MLIKKNFTIGAIATAVLLSSCGEKTQKTETIETPVIVEEQAPEYDLKNPSSMLAAVAYAQGGWDDLYEKKDVQYTYAYAMGDGKTDISTERYIFDTEASYGKYSQNEVNAMPSTKGEIVQFYDGKEAMVMVDGKTMENPEAIAGANFLRRANHFWFVMPYKLSDKGNIFKSLGKETYNDISYDKLEVTYDPTVTGKEQNDSYILYINPQTKLIDRFFFSLPAMGVTTPAIAANYEYEEIEGQMVATKRTYFMPNEKGALSEMPSITQTLTDVTFNNGFDGQSIMK